MRMKESSFSFLSSCKYCPLMAYMENGKTESIVALMKGAQSTISRRLQKERKCIHVM